MAEANNEKRAVYRNLKANHRIKHLLVAGLIIVMLCIGALASWKIVIGYRSKSNPITRYKGIPFSKTTTPTHLGTPQFEMSTSQLQKLSDKQHK